MSGSKRQRVIYTGIDGGSWNILEPMMAAGRLPNLARLRAAGASGVLKSTVPVNSSVAWASFMTGCHAGKHGVFFFREQRHGSYQRPVISFHSIKAPTVWRLASEHGKRVVVLYFPLTYPVEPVNGVMVGGLLTPDRHADFVHPRELRQELERVVGDVPSDNEPEKHFHAGDLQAAQQSLLHVTEQITRMSEYLLEKEDPDLFAVVFRGVDLVSHQAWCYQDPEWAARHPEEARERAHLVGMMYELVDACIGRIHEQARRFEEQGDQVSWICSSDHGFGPITWRVYLNKWLVDHGYLVLKRGARTANLRLFLTRKWLGLLRRLGVLRFLNRRGRFTVPSQEGIIQDMVDWSRTRAWSSMSGGEDIVLINLKGREPEGVVEPGAEYERLRDEIIAGLKEIRAEDGTRIFPEVYRREELWSGPQLAVAPDIQCYTHESSVNMSAQPMHARVVERAEEGRPAMHRIDGMYMMAGAGVFQEGLRRDGPRIADMGPTLLHLLGLPVEDYMDGRVLEDLLTEEYRAAHPVQIREGHVRLEEAAARGPALSADEEAKLVETMQALGYME